MNKKNLIFRYAFVFLLLGVVASFVIEFYKNEQIQTQLQDDTQAVKLSYKNAYEHSKQIAELIFVNNLLYDEKIISLYQNSSLNKAAARAELYEYLKEKFFYFKTFGIKQINFYLSNNEAFLRMKNKDVFGDIVNNRESLLFVNSSLQSIDGIEVSETFPSVSFMKPLMDNHLKPLGVIEIEFSFDAIANLMEKDLEFDVFFIYNNKTLEKKLLKQQQKHFVNFDLNSSYSIEDNVFKFFKYKPTLFEKIGKDRQNIIKDNMENAKEFAYMFFYDKKYQSSVFLPLFNALTNENSVYVVAAGTDKDSDIDKILNRAQWELFFFLSLFLLFFVLTYLLNIYNYRYTTIVKKYDDVLMAIDKYVVMIETDTSGFITNITEAFCDLCGYTKKEIVGRNINIIRHPDMSKKFFENMWKDLHNHKKWEGEIKNIDKNGNSYWVKGIIFPKYDLNQNVIGYSSIRMNITDAKQLKKINNLLKEDLSNKLNEIKMRDDSLVDKTKIILMGKILDSVSHQWKNPISNISIQLAQLSARIEKEDMTPKSLKNIHDKVEEELKILSMTLNEFKTFFSDQNSNDKYNVFSAVNESISLVKNSCQIHNISITIESKKEIYCYGVFNEIKQIMINILKSSIEQFIANSIEKGEIKISIIEDNQDVLIKYQDNVQGESKNIINEVFSDHYDEKTNINIGINLYIVKLLIEKIGAQIWFDNELNKTVFYIKLVNQDRRKERRV
ncbi:MAG: PAS domain S-box protein [Candidatus Marinarcus sp.]|uniref:PAS domain-containing sensor histidine kinase n=1 Tax=Candidatus Marinarcus sp. TaxID=3100987 RepID=UPI003B005D57